METKLLPRESSAECDQMKSDNSGAHVHVIQITEETLRNIIQESVGEAMTRLGVGWEDPLEMQKDFNHLREWRQTTDVMKRRSITAFFVTLFSGIAAACWLGIKTILTTKTGG